MVGLVVVSKATVGEEEEEEATVGLECSYDVLVGCLWQEACDANAFYCITAVISFPFDKMQSTCYLTMLYRSYE